MWIMSITLYLFAEGKYLLGLGLGLGCHFRSNWADPVLPLYCEEDTFTSSFAVSWWLALVPHSPVALALALRLAKLLFLLGYFPVRLSNWLIKFTKGFLKQQNGCEGSRGSVPTWVSRVLWRVFPFSGCKLWDCLGWVTKAHHLAGNCWLKLHITTAPWSGQILQSCKFCGDYCWNVVGVTGGDGWKAALEQAFTKKIAMQFSKSWNCLSGQLLADVKHSCCLQFCEI